MTIHSTIDQSKREIQFVHTMQGTYALVEPHGSGHAHYEYSSALAQALAAVLRDVGTVHLLVNRSCRKVDTNATFHLEPVLDPPRPLSLYSTVIWGLIDRCLHWRRFDSQVTHWVEARSSVKIVHYQIENGISTILGLWRLHRRGCKAILTLHNVRPHARRFWQVPAIKNAIDRWVYKQFDAVIVHSQGLRTQLYEFLGGNSPSIIVIPHGVWELPDRESLPRLRERMRDKKLLFVGVPRANKGLEFLLQAIQRLRGYSLTLAGFQLAGSYGTEVIDPLISSARALGIEIDVRRGYVDDAELDRILREHSAIVLPYTRRFQAQSGVLCRAISYRLPVLVTDVGALGETVRAFNVGTVVTPEDPVAMATGIDRLFERSPEDLERRLDVAMETLSWRRCAEAMMNAYCQALSNSMKK